MEWSRPHAIESASAIGLGLVGLLLLARRVARSPDARSVVLLGLRGSALAILVLIIVYFVAKAVFGIDLLDMLNGGGNVKERADQEHEPDDPEELTVAKFRPACFPQKSRVGVDFFLAGKDLEIAHHVSDDEEDQDRSRNRHNNFFADHGGPKGH